MMWLDTILLVTVTLTIVIWAGLSAYVLRVQRRREATRATLARTLDTLDQMSRAPIEERLALARGMLKEGSRELIMRGAADRDLPDPAFDAIVALLSERWGLDALVRDAGAHQSTRDKWRRMTALRILARRGHAQALDLLARATEDADVDVATTGLALLGRSHDPRAVDLLVEALASPRLSAARVAVYLDQSPQDLGERLVALLDHQKPVVRQWAAALLARYPDQPVEPRLADLTRDADPQVRKAAVQTLGRIGGDEAAHCALHLLTDPAPYVRAHAVRALGELGRVDCADRVSSLLGDGDWWVRLAARESLEMMGAEVWPVLVRCLDHRDRFVRNGAAEVVQNLGVLDSLIMLEAATDNPAGTKVAMLQRIAAAGGVRFTESLVERAGPIVGPRVRRLLDTMGLEHVEAV
ncbi:MAG: HEAT repeat domain-containing protein [Vicinamibacterales bacterium]